MMWGERAEREEDTVKIENSAREPFLLEETLTNMLFQQGFFRGSPLHWY